MTNFGVRQKPNQMMRFMILQVSFYYFYFTNEEIRDVLGTHQGRFGTLWGQIGDALERFGTNMRRTRDALEGFGDKL